MSVPPDWRARRPSAALAGLVAGLGIAGTGGPSAVVAGLAAVLVAAVLVRRVPEGPASRPMAATPQRPWRLGDLGAPALSSMLLAAAAGVALGGLVGALRTAQRTRTELRPLLGHVHRGDAVLLEPARRGSFGRRTALVALRGERVLVRAGGQVRWPWARPGDVLAVSGVLRPPDDFARARGAHAEWRADAVRPTGRRRGGVAGRIDGARRRAEAALSRGLPPAESGLLRGMVLGQDDGLPDDLRQDFRDTGLTHLVAASGTNIALLCSLVVGVASMLGAGLRTRWWLALAAIAVYVPLAGAGPSIQRAGVMGAAGAAAVLAGRPASRWWALGLAGAVTLGLDPAAVRDPGWQLSFVAVLGLVLLAPRWRSALIGAGVPTGLAEAVAISAAASLVTAPVLVWHFGELPLVGVVANLLVAPLVPPVMWLGTAAATLGVLVEPFAAVLYAVAGGPLRLLIAIAGVGARSPLAVVSPAPAAVAAVVVLACAVTALPTGRLRRRGRRGVVLAAATALLVVGVAAARSGGLAPPDGLRVTFLDIGQGDATLVQSGSTSILVDAGPPDGPVLERLRQAGVRRLDLLVATHGSTDHIGGTAQVLRRLPVGLVLDGHDAERNEATTNLVRAAAARGVRRVPSVAGQRLRVGEMEVDVLWPRPGANAGLDPNLRATVLVVRSHGRRVLLTADAESEVLSGLALPRVDVMKAAHHGSADPGLPAVLARARPTIVGIVVGRRNTYNLPAPSTVAALRAAVPQVVRTDLDGTVRLDLAPSGWEVRRDGR